MKTKYMKRAIELAKKGRGYTNPNPLVGAVIVKNDEIIGEGYHEFYGGPHAEVNAFRNAIKDVGGATMYVTLEPCSHFGKTPPCANNIVNKGISKVLIGMRDPNPLVAGKGIEILKNEGIDVEVGILEEEVKKLNEIFVKYITKKRPFCILKTAMTLDGKIATVTGDSKWITNEESRKYVHNIRHHVSAIMVGIGTVLVDNPRLTTRIDEKNGLDPIRIIVDTKGKIPLNFKVLNIESDAKTIIATTKYMDEQKIKAIQEKGGDVIITPLKNDRVDIEDLMDQLYKMKIDSVLLEGGSTLNYSALEEGIVDKVVSFISPKIIGGQHAKTPVGGKGKEKIRDAFNLENVSLFRFHEDIMIEGYLRKEDE
ncbi:bifunctional diaminohydroxyphosphoribosylaminopyrimidine deaminase/5-amino-6-(5-phosphoribosylamino)uracil reductase RibD [Clostridium sp. D2Q-14]|uniref:bifunctional diaminohydroxyphosphoribosylaminopyrimidine deaminase/5-amino-6-(5-phosphoribosylamino)uracil reductase RibD n=1 Tax=Anaeromonas gelatinilytica TaxID=2683194 RepID=UPI00193B118B|nr:bifunctional diaminohydroxyphosphoribosylaminopyrimidine deaminase/5-amino-6-(5-phosphoribosylamino)uracil reductase RibD [Anaeromonas gelatinilytica]MBS4536146.1 bifunctional diaminohydroxyphosphoribosylaminopyrimidine deaminase/5-amino-6-(5-phosphoribosylamino)uracil reductase RibD [Anaeromonas gelatinilytica]